MTARLAKSGLASGMQESRRRDTGTMRRTRQILLIEDEAVAGQALSQSLQGLGMACIAQEVR